MLAMGTLRMPNPEEALPGRDEPMQVPPRHTVLGTPLLPPFPEGFERAVFGMGCFWGAERLFWQAPGVWTTAVGYAGGYTPNPTHGMRQGNDMGTQYRSGIWVADDGQRELAEDSRTMFGDRLLQAGHGEV